MTTGNPQPVIAHSNRAGDNLFTASIVALNPDTGKMAWYFQSSPHDTHDWDATQTPVLFDGEINGQPRKLLAQAARNGHFFVLDRTTGKALVSTEYVKTNWSKGYDEKGQPIPNPGEGAAGRRRAGVARTRAARPTGRRRASARRPACSTSAPRAPTASTTSTTRARTRRAGAAPIAAAGRESMIQAIDYKTGKVKWSHKWEGGHPRRACSPPRATCSSPAAPSSDLVALNATTGDALWHARLGAAVSNGPITYELDGTQYLVVGAGDTLWAFAMQHTHDGAKPSSGR